MRKSLTAAAALFDLDGTVFDSVELWHEIDDIFLAKRGRTPDDEYKRSIAVLGFTKTAYFTIDYYGLDDTPEQLMREWTELAADAYANTVPLFDGAKEYLEECRAAGVKVAAVTSLRGEFARSCLQNNGALHCFTHIFTADEVGLSKNSPEIYLHAARVLGVDPALCVVFDDVPEPLRSAKDAGMTAVAVRGKMMTAESVADLAVDSLKDAPRLVLAKSS